MTHACVVDSYNEIKLKGLIMLKLTADKDTLLKLSEMDTEKLMWKKLNLLHDLNIEIDLIRQDDSRRELKEQIPLLISVLFELNERITAEDREIIKKFNDELTKAI